ncbi:uncharacterized protein DUF3558 [Prauserella shujinwangii]|uniref:Uncharacterized protein DUF3558 n=1 Tax=Prauserella shujinwangii TaxID=1453103 RepID=A0A2T0LY64_9PSEU|nr:uncharacterized protein DUF3558 [Prauserella shujinwangii]
MPPVSQELDATPYLTKPCELVPDTTLESLGFALPGEPLSAENESTADLVGPSCGWWLKPGNTLLSVGIQTGNREHGVGGLRGLRGGYERGQYAYWESTNIGGYPAAYYDIDDERQEGRCRLAVGIADDLTFSVSAGVYENEPQQACSTVEKVATDVIGTLKRGA